ncbi:MAG: iron-containing alcohol dehydrogenase [Chloroflexota bacterium]|nr:iron-containing alcohol dehydrogenase [Chloroflexota bacterium]MDE2840950.1 iron-containing alcohol dehydrogenase [Chloroflexota bacterium]MDE2932188.1 iron-containing alcohol dehydrogenase [Chloroflexota bacterium]
MAVHTFAVTTRVHSGPGAVAEIGPTLTAQDHKSVLVVTDQGIVRAGLLTPVTDSLHEAGVSAAVFDEVMPDPEESIVEAVVAAYCEADCDGLLAVGGGSSLDVAKAAGVVITNGGAVAEYEGFDAFENDLPPLYAVPTTVGTGSEVTFAAVITLPSQQFKMSILSTRLAPRAAFLDPAMLTTLPPHVVAHSGMDALTHSVEGMTSPLSTPFTNAFNLHAIRLISENLRAAVANSGDMEAIGNMQYAACIAGVGFAHSRLGIVHAMAHPVGAYHHLPHGLSNALLLPHCLDFNRIGCEPQLAIVAREFDATFPGQTEREAALAAIAAIRDLEADIGIPASMGDAGVTDEHFDAIVKDTFRSRNVGINPRRVTEEDIRQILYTAL